MEAVKVITQAIKNTLNPQKIVLFGSQAKGTSSHLSDIDIAVIQEQNPRLKQKAKIYLELERLGYNWLVDPDIHLFSAKDFEKKLKEKDLFALEISKGKFLYG